LATQRLEYLRERESSLTQFLSRAEGQISGIEESIAFTQRQINEEEEMLAGLTGQLEEVRAQVDEKRAVLDEHRHSLNTLRSSYQQVQRSQFDAEKKVAIADTSIQNIQRTIFHLEEEIGRAHV